MPKIHGKNFAVYADGVKVGDNTDCTLTVNQALEDASSKDDANWKYVVPGMRDWQVSVSFLYDEANSLAPDDILDMILNADQVVVEFSQATASTVYWYGNAYVSTGSVNAPMSTANGSVTFIGDGPLNKATIS